MLEFDNLLIRQDDFELRANWTAETSQKLAIIGPSGGGKTTFLSALAGFVTPVSGRIALDGQDITSLAPAERPVSFLFQSHNLFPHLTVFQNVGLGVRPDLKLSADEVRAVKAELAKVGLQGKGEVKPAHLSGGQAQRVALARALLRKKPLLLLDEPFAALGPALKGEMLDLVEEIIEETQATLLMVTHDPSDAQRIADMTVLVANGVAEAPVRTSDLFADPPDALSDYLG